VLGGYLIPLDVYKPINVQGGDLNPRVIVGGGLLQRRLFLKLIKCSWIVEYSLG